MNLVVDASVALKWFVDEPGSDQARALIDEDAALMAPELLVAEVCNGAWRLARLGVLGAAERGTIASEIATLFDRVVPLTPLAPRAMLIAAAVDHPVYDCFYVALAEREACRLVTADGRFRERLQGSEWQGLVQDLYAMPAG